jgi:hypothetical protein
MKGRRSRYIKEPGLQGNPGDEKERKSHTRMRVRKDMHARRSSVVQTGVSMEVDSNFGKDVGHPDREKAQ